MSVYKVLLHKGDGKVYSRTMELPKDVASAVILGMRVHPGGYKTDLGFGAETVIHFEEVK